MPVDRQKSPGQKDNGYTMAELMIVVVIVGITAGLVIPNFNKTMEVAHEDDAIMHLRAIHAANLAYFARNDQWWPPDNTTYDVASINAALRLNIFDGDMTYTCTGTDGTTFACTATRAGGAYTVQVDEDDLAPNNANPCSTRNGASCS